MKVTSLHYSKVFSLGNYENEKIGVDIEIDHLDNIGLSMIKASEFVRAVHETNLVIRECQSIMQCNDKESKTYKAYEDINNKAIEKLKQIQINYL